MEHGTWRCASFFWTHRFFLPPERSHPENLSFPPLHGVMLCFSAGRLLARLCTPFRMIDVPFPPPILNIPFTPRSQCPFPLYDSPSNIFLHFDRSMRTLEELQPVHFC